VSLTVSRFLVSVDRMVDAPAQHLFDLVADPANHPLIDGSGSVRAARDGNPDRLALGAHFSMDMRLGTSYRIENEVVEFEDGRLIGWRHFNGHIWRWRFDPVEDGRTRVTEQWDARPARFKLGLLLVGFDRRNRRGMQRSLERLAELATSAATE
jgi:uncharacterized protein YndB with AHSA1/START domain